MSINYNARHISDDAPELYPTPKQATRAFFHYIIPDRKNLKVFEPAAGYGDMMSATEDYGHEVEGSDIELYPTAREDIVKQDFLDDDFQPCGYDLIITNPPFKFAEEFFHKANRLAPLTALFVRLQQTDSIKRYNSIFSKNPPTSIASFPERVNIHRNRCAPETQSFVSYAWFFWDRGRRGDDTHYVWIPPCKKDLERAGDYDGYPEI